MGEIESGSSHEGGLPDDAVSTSTEDTSVATAVPDAPKRDAAKRRTMRRRAAKKPVSEDTSGRPDLTKVAERRAASRNKRIKRAKEEA